MSIASCPVPIQNLAACVCLCIHDLPCVTKSSKMATRTAEPTSTLFIIGGTVFWVPKCVLCVSVCSGGYSRACIGGVVVPATHPSCLPLRVSHSHSLHHLALVIDNYPATLKASMRPLLLLPLASITTSLYYSLSALATHSSAVRVIKVFILSAQCTLVSVQSLVINELKLTHSLATLKPWLPQLSWRLTSVSHLSKNYILSWHDNTSWGLLLIFQPMIPPLNR